MTTDNPYIAPRASDDEPSPANARELLALRQQYLYRETTVRAWGGAKFLVGLTVAIVVPIYPFAEIGLPDQSIQVRVGIAGYAVAWGAVGIAMGCGLLFLQHWGRLMQMNFCTVGSMFAFISIANRVVSDHDGIVVCVFPLAMFAGILLTFAEHPTQAVCSRRYRDAVRITRASRVLGSIIFKAVGFVVADAMLFVTTGILLVSFLQ